MRKIIITLGLWFLVTGLWAQDNKGAKIGPVSQAIQKSTVDGNKYTIQVGLPYLGQNNTARATNPLDIRFPWDVLYLYKTFADESFEVSKGYFGDKILINWTLRANIDAVTNIKILRRPYTDDNSGQFVQKGNVSKFETEFEDRYVEGGVLYEYKVVAEGVSVIESEYDTYITGIGYRNPTAIVTGNVSYKGGNPVKDVTIRASSEGSSVNAGSALNIPNTGALVINGLNKPITKVTTLQAWLKPVAPYTNNTGQAIRLFGGNNLDVHVKLLAASKILSVKIGNSEYQLKNVFPSGNLDSRGDDILVPVSDFNSNFVHFSVVINHGNVPLLYINGREINEDYSKWVNDKLNANNEAYSGPYLEFVIPTQTININADWNTVYVGGNRNAYVDEIRVWNAVKEPLKIRTDYRRYIGGNDATLISYLRANEGAGAYAYDLSRTGFDYNKNHGKLWDSSTAVGARVSWEQGAGNIPSSDQLGILGVTDVNGNYEITAIPYSGTGESFNITPLYGVHQFEPGQQLVFLGQGSEVVNKINFTDVSSFSFKGKVLYDTRGVFKSFKETASAPINGDDYYEANQIIGEGYNYYETLSAGKLSKGEYWYNDNETPADESDDFIERYARIASEGVNVYIDGNIVLDENNIPVVSDAEGIFDISVPIGKHYITLKKNGHVFAHNSRFPAESGTFKEFFEDSNEAVVFVDSTRVTLVGRVVGGTVEAEKVIGFGENGLFEKSITDADEVSKTITISSKNNIGVADITLGYKPGGAPVTENSTFNFKTNSASGEYRVSLLPLNYELQASNINITSAKDYPITIIEAGVTEEVKVSNAVGFTTPLFEYEDGNSETGMPYHFEKSFTYRSTPILKVVEQTSDLEIDLDGIKISTEGFEYLVYSQFKEYKVILNRFERYINYDDGELEDLVPVVEGQLLINNNLALKNVADKSETSMVDDMDGSILTYTFFAGLPAISAPFTLSSSLQYRINGIDYDVENYKDIGIVLGGNSDGSQTFVTEAPDVPSIILRDPPGSNSFASIQEGESITFTTESSEVDMEGFESEFKLMIGLFFEIGGGLAGPVFEFKKTNSLFAGIGLTNTSKDGESLTQTYEFSQTISTSADPSYVGSDGDLYIGNSKNQLYGSFNDIQLSGEEKNSFDDSASFELKNYLGESVFVSKQKAIYFVEEPSETFYVFSQKHILETLIPEYEFFITNIENGIPADTNDGKYPKDLDQYKEQVRLWKKVILDNEKSKFLAMNERPKYQASLINVVSNFNDKLITAINNSEDSSAELSLIDKLAESNKVKGLLNTYFEDNISFDAGVGEFTRSVETTVINKTSTDYNFTLKEEFGLELGATVSKIGFATKTKGVFQQDVNTSLSNEDKNTLNISYTLKDNDPANLLSIDVVNSFDGNGPVFITQGGRTSCPYEGAEESKFFTNDKFIAYFKEYFRIQNEIDVNEKAINKNEEEFVILERAYRSYISVENKNAYDENRSERGLLEVKRKSLNEEASDHEDEFSKDVDCCPEDPNDPDINKKAPLSFATQKVEVPLLSVEVADISNVSEYNNAEFKLLLENNSVTETDATFLLKIDNTTNPNNALINIEQNGILVSVPYGKKTYYTLTLGKSISDVYDYENIRVVLQSTCDGEAVSDDVFVSAHFIPSCSEVVVNAPLENWTYNISEAYNTDGSTKPLTVSMIGFNTNFSSFKKIELEYRSATAPNWTRLHSYYGEEHYETAVADKESEISLISTPSLSYSFNISELNLRDGDYEIRARSICTNNTEYISEVITGRVDLTSPQRFGTPLPIDGILGVGEDLRVSFNENIFYNQAISTIEIKGQTNQLPINHSVSLHFEGATRTAVINDPKITSGDFALEFWMNNATVANTADIMKQEGGLNIGLSNGGIFFTLGGVVAQGSIANDGVFHHYTCTYESSTGDLRIFQDDAEIGGNTGVSNMNFTNNNPLVIGGNTFIGNIHNLRLWNKTISLDVAYAKMYDKLIGNEANLIGYWPMDEGRGEITKDLARFKHAIVNSDWDIKPKGTSYEFVNGQYLELNDVDFVQLTNEMDATISFWMKTDTAQEATLFSNGKGDGSDIVQSNGQANKWAINLTSSGMLTLASEGKSYTLTNQSVVDGNWHHVTLLFNRIGSLRTYIDAAPVSSNLIAAIGGFSGNKIWIGARGSKDLAGDETVDNTFSGKIDEIRLWNTLRNVEQISRDRFNEMDVESIGLVFYARMNADAGNTPRYFHAAANEKVSASLASISNGTVNYSNDVPAIKPARELIKFGVNHVINEDEMILEPVVTDWASLEGQVLDITVHRMFDSANNRQQSPITWTAYVKRNEVSWFAEGYNEIVDIVKNTGAVTSFEITLLNKGGNGQPYQITNIPSWLKLSATSGILQPDSKVVLTATIDKDLTAGNYLENLYLQTDFGYDEKMQVKVRVLAPEPEWTINPTGFDFSMNMVGRVKINGTFSEDSYDKIAAFSNGELRGSAALYYNEAFKEYYAYLTVYSNSVYGETMSFRIWDASQGKIIEAVIDGNATTIFKDNEVSGSLSNPVIFENSDVLVQDITLNKGWTWVSLNVNDSEFSNLNALTEGMHLNTNDRILSHSPAQLDTYYKDASHVGNSTWSGTVTSNGGISTSKMYKVNFNLAQSLNIKGVPVDMSTWSFPIKTNWNWVPYPLLQNQAINEALAYFDAEDGDVIKSQNLFAIYDRINGWNGTLNYLVSGTGYMIKSSKDQPFTYPSYLANQISKQSTKVTSKQSAGKMADEFKQYAGNMNAIVQLPEGYNELFVYDEAGVLKGKQANQLVNDKALSFITIYGDAPENLVFHIGDGTTKKVTSKQVTFKGNSVLGTVAEPLVLEDDSLQGLKMYPNPFNSNLVLELYSDAEQVMDVKLYNVVGQIVYTTNKMLVKGNNKLELTPKVQNGVYFLNVYLNDVVSVYRVVKN
ncbi:LamG-like jellyroll fold domain-containing protein [Mariniflexile sp. AS56]|uniref:LamG-like jellyroll fold domain-containing protein n=1 Tax=Mariniflexile sp. AS56 TaxID=3063957 RepID=UPI0026F14048|nr:LamG-like jellyroll fold domain-containing protein [Mariniflexile sp. AS56]MDO7171829.1 LamG-like jellyroll fold domain-containing protein [Mariniflexile sp. AS56]